MTSLFSLNCFGQNELINRLKYEASKSTNSDDLIDLNLKIALEYYHQGKLNEALTHASYAKGHIKNYTNQERVANVHLYMGNLLLELSQFNEALEHFQIAHENFEIVGDQDRVTTVTANMGVVFERIGNYELALEYARRVISYRKESNDSVGLAQAYTNIGNIYDELEKYELAFNYYREAAIIDSIYDLKDALSIDYNNLGFVFQHLQEDALALLYFEKSLEIDIENRDIYNQSIVLTNIGEILNEQGEGLAAKDTIVKALELAKQSGSLQQIGQCYKILSTVEQGLGNDKASYVNYKLFQQYEDSIESKRNEVSEEEVQISGDIKEVDIVPESDWRDNLRWFFILVLVAFTFGLSAWFMVRLVKNQNDS